MKKIKPSELVLMHDNFYRVELAYARDDNILFGERIYRKDACLWLHTDLASIVKQAARLCLDHHGMRFVLYDGLRTTDAQAAMMETQRVKDNPHWLQEPRLLSPPGGGGHPRAMAIDIGLETLDRNLLDMGCPFDYLAENSHKDFNPAHREYKHSQEILDNRKILDECMSKAACDLNLPLLPLPEEWWDFRMPPAVYNQYEPLSDDDLPVEMKLLDY